MTTPDVPVSQDREHPDDATPQPKSEPGVELGKSEEGSTFEPEEDQQG